MEVIKYLWPLVVIQLALIIWALVDLRNKKRTKNLSITIWVIIIIFANILGPILYFLLGRVDD